MGELLDALNEADAGSGAAGERMSSVIDEATESVIGRTDTEPDGPAPRRDTASEVIAGWVRQAPLPSLAVAFLLGVAFSRRGR